MITFPDLEYRVPALSHEILEQMLDLLYHIVPMTKGAADPDTDEKTRQECLARIYENTLKIGKCLLLLKQDADIMDKQLKGLIAYAKQRTTVSLN